MVKNGIKKVITNKIILVKIDQLLYFDIFLLLTNNSIDNINYDTNAIPSTRTTPIPLNPTGFIL